MDKHKSGFVNIIGSPNVGKSSLMNALLGERLAITNRKAQTTRHRIRGIISDDNYQVVFSDTPGVIDPAYAMQEKMMTYVQESVKDADIFLFMTVPGQRKFENEQLLNSLAKTDTPLIVLINKIDEAEQDQVAEAVDFWSEKFPNAQKVIPISVLFKGGIGGVWDTILSLIPEGPAFFPKDQISDRSDRFVASELIREKILKHYKKEIPYSVEVQIEMFKETEKMIHIRGTILVARESQKGIIIGHKGQALKRVSSEARIDMEKYYNHKVFLETFVKVDKDWRNDQKKLERLGY